MPVTYYEDGTPYSFLPAFVDGSVNVGWLDSSMAFTTGEVPDAFVAWLTELCRYPVNITRGWHRCNLCPQPAEPGFPQPATVPSPDGDYAVGHGEIRVESNGGVRHAAPNMIIHYVRKHRYRPPDDFIDAVAWRLR